MSHISETKQSVRTQTYYRVSIETHVRPVD